MTANPPLSPSSATTHIRRLREIIHEFTEELEAMRRLEAALQAAIDRLDRGANLVSMECKHMDALIKHTPAPLKTAPVAAIVDKVEADLQALITAPTNIPAPVKTPS